MISNCVDNQREHAMSRTDYNTDVHFLIVNDDEIQQRVMVQLLKELGYLKVSIASNGAIALRAFRKAQAVGSPIDFVMTDCKMPVMDGLVFLEVVRKCDSLRHVPVLMITDQATETTILSAVKAGADGYIVKPYSSYKLGKKIETLLHKYELPA
jgi:two-component system chemotaxis response regulator CheY